MNAKNKFYVVWHGRQPGIYESWNACKQQVEGFKCAKYKSFKSLVEAEKAFHSGLKSMDIPYESDSSLSDSDNNPIEDSICVDASCSVVKQLMEYRGVHFKTKKVLFHRGPYEGGTNNIGEFLAVVHAMAFMKKQNLQCVIYTDSHTALAWVRDKNVKTSIQPGPKVQELITKAIKWLNTNDVNYRILKWNTKAWGEIPADFGKK